MSTEKDTSKNVIGEKMTASEAARIQPGLIARIHQVNNELTSLVKENPESMDILRAKLNMLTIIEELNEDEKNRLKAHTLNIGNYHEGVKKLSIVRDQRFDNLLAKVHEDHQNRLAAQHAAMFSLYTGGGESHFKTLPGMKNRTLEENQDSILHPVKIHESLREQFGLSSSDEFQKKVGQHASPVMATEENIAKLNDALRKQLTDGMNRHKQAVLEKKRDAELARQRETKDQDKNLVNNINELVLEDNKIEPEAIRLLKLHEDDFNRANLSAEMNKREFDAKLQKSLDEINRFASKISEQLANRQK